MLAYLLRQLPPPLKNNAFSDDKEISKELDAATKALFLAFKDDNKGLIEKLSGLSEDSKKEVVSDIVSKLLESSQPKQTEFKQIGIPIESIDDKVYQGYGLFTYSGSHWDFGSCAEIDKNMFGENNGGKVFPYSYIYDLFSRYYNGPYGCENRPEYWHTAFDKHVKVNEGVFYINDKKEAVLYKFGLDGSNDDLNAACEGKLVNSEDILKSFVSRKLKEEGNFEEAEKLDKNRNLTVCELIDAGRMEDAVSTFKKYCAKTISINEEKQYSRATVSSSEALPIFNYLVDNGRLDETIDIIRASKELKNSSEGLQIFNYLVDNDRLDETIGIIRTSRELRNSGLNDLCNSGNEEAALKIFKAFREKFSEKIDEDIIVKIYTGLRSKGKDVDELESEIVDVLSSSYYFSRFGNECFENLCESGNEEDVARIYKKISKHSDISSLFIKGPIILTMYKALCAKGKDDYELLSKIIEDENLNYIKPSQFFAIKLESNKDEDFEDVIKLAKSYAEEHRKFPIAKEEMVKVYEYLSKQGRIDEAVDVVSVVDATSVNAVLDSLLSTGKDEDMEIAIKLAKRYVENRLLNGDVVETYKSLFEISKYMLSKGRKDETLSMLDKFLYFDSFYFNEKPARFHMPLENENFETALLMMQHYPNRCVFDDVLKMCKYLSSKKGTDETIKILPALYSSYSARGDISVEEKIDYDNQLENMMKSIRMQRPGSSDRVRMYNELKEQGKNKEAVEILMRDPKTLSNVITDLFEKKKLRELGSLLKMIKDYN